MSTAHSNLNLIDLMQRFSTPEAARAYLEGLRWANGVSCAHCGVVGNSAKLGGASAKRGLYKCRDCRKLFTVCVGTIFEDSKIPLNKWVIAFHLLAASKKGMSAHQLHRMLGISYKSAWHMAHRIRFAMQGGMFTKLDGIVEVDETYVGGKAKNAHASKPIPKKTAVLALVSRGGKMKARTIANVTSKTIGKVLKKHVAKTAEIFTDSLNVYPSATKGLLGHESVNHDAGEYVRGMVHTNTVESFNAILKRGIVGVYHHVSETHLDRYLDEYGFRWNNRNITDGERATLALRQSEGKRLTYRDCMKEVRVA